MSGSRPLAEAVTRSTGMGSVLSGSAIFSASIRAFTASSNAGLVGPKFEPPEELALFGMGVVADNRPQKYLGSWKDWEMSEEPTTLLSRTTKLPDAWPGKAIFPMPVTTRG